jgi:23S rRNA pseudouridine1911/1915/1917 synthase
MLNILYEDNHLLVINKPCGILVQGDETGDEPLVEMAKAFIKQKYQKPGEVFLGVVHRLDRPVSGVVVFARTSKALERMNELFRNKETKKTYLALVTTRPPKDTDTLIHWLEKDEKRNKTTAYIRESAKGQRSELTYQLKGHSSGKFLLEVNPVTGRPHQIRVQLATMGCPILGDLKYGAAAPLPNASIALHAHKLEFIHPVKKERIEIVADLPPTNHWKTFPSLFSD